VLPRIGGISVSLTRALYQNSIFFFAFFLVGAVVGFWPRYLSEITSETDLQRHFHGAMMASWLVLLVAQAYFIRAGHREIHRRIGKLSYVIAPAAVVSVVLIAHNALSASPELTSRGLITLGTRLGSGALFALAYALAIKNRHEPATHARFMLCTPLPSTGPIFDRVLLFHVAPQFDFLPRFIDGQPFPLYVTLPSIDLVLIGLTIWDWKVHRRWNVFPTMLGAFFIVQFLAFSQYDSALWRSFAEWFLRLPLS